ncbi:MAG: hypothetical protein H0U74_07460 [Bradymonadaceae bacterium]|nr:hypothetical protein [Lujinxingiaceae bacterium]
MLEFKEKKGDAPTPASAPIWEQADGAAAGCVIHAESERGPGRVVAPHGEVRFVNVSGSQEAMARQLGQRTMGEVHKGAAPFFATYLERVLKNSPISKASGVLHWATHRWVTARLRQNMPREFEKTIAAFAEGAQISVDTLYDAYLMPESFLWLVGTYNKTLGSKRALGLGAPPLCGCTSAIVVPPGSETTLHGRNFDYFGIDYWDQYATVVFYHPDDGIDYVSVTTAGFIGGGVTAMNAAGLTLAVHQHFVDRFDLDGVPVGLAGDEVMRRAHSIEEAVSILRDYPPIAGWTYVMSEGDTGRAAIFEVAPGRENLHFLPNGKTAMGYANVYWGADFKKCEVDYYPEYRRCNYARQARVVDCLNAIGEQDATAQVLDIAKILGDCEDPDGAPARLFGPTIAAANTVASVVFEPAKRRVWVGTGRSPSSRRWFVPFTLDREGEGRRGGPDTTVAPFTAFPGWEDGLHGRAFELYRHACHLFWEGESDERLLIMIEYALALYPQEPNLHVLAGLLALRIQRGQRAEGAFRRALELFTESSRRSEVGLYLAWALDLQGQRTAARHIYGKIAKDPAAESTTVTRARQGRWVRFSANQAAKVPLDFIYAGVP